jgi:hypothetical protein
MKRFVMTVALALAGFALGADAQTAGGAPAPGKAPEQGGAGRAGMHQPPSPEKIAEELMKKFDADMDGKLSQAELTQALEALGEHHHRMAGGRGKRGRGGARGLGSSSALGNPDAKSSSDPQNSSGAQASSDPQSDQGGSQTRPSSDQIAARLIEKFASDKKGLTGDELAKAIREHRANRGQSQGQ